MAGAVPRAFGVVPVDEATHVRTDWRSNDHRTAIVAERRHLLAPDLQNLALAAFQRPQAAALGTGEPVAHQIVRIVLVLADVVPQPAADLRPAGVEQLAPG